MASMQAFIHRSACAGVNVCRAALMVNGCMMVAHDMFLLAAGTWSMAAARSTAISTCRHQGLRLWFLAGKRLGLARDQVQDW
jgi:hypothetical protein